VTLAARRRGVNVVPAGVAPTKVDRLKRLLEFLERLVRWLESTREGGT